MAKKETKKTTYSTFVSAIAAKEGKKTQTSVGNIREILKLTIDVAKEDPDHMRWLLNQLMVHAVIAWDFPET